MPKLPNAANAIVELGKLTYYSLNLEHRRGREKARLFRSMLGIEATDAPALRDALLDAARTLEAIEHEGNECGTGYMIEFEMSWEGRRAILRSIWFVRAGEDVPRLVSCFPLTGRRP